VKNLKAINFCKECKGLMILIRVRGKTVYKCTGCGLIQDIEILEDNLLSLDKNLIDIYYGAIDLFEQSDFKQALELFYEVINSDPTDEESWYYAGLIHLIYNDNEEAAYHFNSALIINPEFLDVWYGIGIIYYRIGRFDDAIEAYTKSLDTDPDLFALEWLQYIDYLIESNIYKEALEELKGIIDFSNIFLLEDIYFKAKERIEEIQEKQQTLCFKEDESLNEANFGLISSKKKFKIALEEKGVYSLFYICGFENIPSILQMGILSRNYSMKKNIEFIDISLSEVQRHRKKHMKDNYNLNIHDFACLFFISHTPMLRNVCFSQYKDHEIAIIQLDPRLMDDLDNVFFTDRSCARKNFNLYNNLEDLNILNWEYITKDYDLIFSAIKPEEVYEFKGIRGAEVLISEKIDPYYIIPEIIVKSEKAKESLSKLLLEKNLGSISLLVDPYSFPLRTSSNAYKSKMRKFRSYF